MEREMPHTDGKHNTQPHTYVERTKKKNLGTEEKTPASLCAFWFSNQLLCCSFSSGLGTYSLSVDIIYLQIQGPKRHKIISISIYLLTPLPPSLPPSLPTFPHRPIRLDHCIQAREHEQRGPQREEDQEEKEGEDGLLIPVAVA